MTTIVLDQPHRSAVDRTGRGIEFLLSSAETAGTLAILDCQIPPGTSGPPLHVHPGSEETFLVTAGILLIRVGEEVVQVAPGGLVHVSRGTPHTFATTPAAAAGFLVVHTPGGFEQFHVAAASAERDSGAALTPNELAAVAAGFDWRPVGPPLSPSGSLAGAQA